MIPPLYKWYPMVQPGGEPTKTDALERRAERLTEDYKQALKMKKMDDKRRSRVVKILVQSNHLRQVLSGSGGPAIPWDRMKTKQRNVVIRSLREDD